MSYQIVLDGELNAKCFLYEVQWNLWNRGMRETGRARPDSPIVTISPIPEVPLYYLELGFSVTDIRQITQLLQELSQGLWQEPNESWASIKSEKQYLQLDLTPP